MHVSLQSDFTYTSEQCSETGVPRQIGTQRQCIDKKADQALLFFLSAIGNGSAHHEIGLTTVTHQQYLKSC